MSITPITSNAFNTLKAGTEVHQAPLKILPFNSCKNKSFYEAAPSYIPAFTALNKDDNYPIQIVLTLKEGVFSSKLILQASNKRD